jgi:hypothetical protein
MKKGLFWLIVAFTACGYYYWVGIGEPELKYRESYSSLNHTQHYHFDQGVMRKISDRSLPADKDIQSLLSEMGLPSLQEGGVEILLNGYDKDVGSTSVTWNGYQGGRLIAYIEECGNENCVSRITLVPDPRERLRHSASQSSRRIFVEAETYGEKWPLTVDYGVISCQRPGAIFFSTADQGKFPLNSLAKSSPTGTKDLSEIWRDHPSPYTQKYQIGDLINQGLEICD